MCDLIGISVVVLSYNHGRFIDAAIKSLLDQNYPNLEIIVVDSGLKDDTVSADKRLNISPAYLRSGFVFGDSCLSKVLRALTGLARGRGVSLPVLEGFRW